MSEPPEELVAVKIGWVPRWQQNHLDAVRRAWVQLLTWLREHHRKQFDSFDGSIEAYYTRRFLDSISNANAPMAVNTETSAQPFLRDGQSVAPSIKIALTWLQEHLGVNLLGTLSLEAIPRAPQRPSRPATAIPLKACCTLEKTAASRLPLPLRIVCSFACLMILGVSRFTQVQESRWVSVYVLPAKDSSLEGDQPRKEMPGCEQVGAFLLVRSRRLHAAQLALGPSRSARAVPRRDLRSARQTGRGTIFTRQPSCSTVLAHPPSS
jgi:hypothetical protein